MSARAVKVEASLVLVEPAVPVVPEAVELPEPKSVDGDRGTGFRAASATNEVSHRMTTPTASFADVGDLAIWSAHALTRQRDTFGDPIGGPGGPVTYHGDDGSMFSFPPQGWNELFTSGPVGNGSVIVYAQRLTQANFDERRNDFRYDVPVPGQNYRGSVRTTHDDLGAVTGFGEPVSVSAVGGGTEATLVAPPSSYVVAAHWQVVESGIGEFTGGVDVELDWWARGLGESPTHNIFANFAPGGPVTVQFPADTTAWVVVAIPLLGGAT